MLKQKASVSLSEASLELLYEEEAVKLWEMAIIEALCARKAQSRHVLPISTAPRFRPELLPNAGTVGSQCVSDSQEMSAIVLPRLLVKSALVTVVQRGTMPKVPN